MRLVRALILLTHLSWVCGDLRARSRDYGVVVDAGSSGSRIRVYEWAERTDRYQLPTIREVFSYKVKPGISAFGDQLPALEAYLRGLIDRARNIVPHHKHPSSSVYLMATAGMRLLLEDNANAVMDKLDSILSEKRNNPFQYESLNTRILSGEEEGVFAWIAVNYLDGFFSRPRSSDDLGAGVLELGGASTQIVVQHGGAILADKFPVKIAGTTYPLYVHSYLYYGQTYVVQWIHEQLLSEAPNRTDVIEDPCMLKGDSETFLMDGKNETFRGSGKPLVCIEHIHRLVYKVDDWRCHPKPCAIGTVYQPSISPEQIFYAVSAFVFPLQTLGVIGADGRFSPRQTMEAARTFCQRHIEDIRKEQGSGNSFLSTECLMGMYMSILFTKGYGFSNNTDKLYAVKKINDNPAEWALGAVIYENERKDWICPEAPRVGAVSSSADLVRLEFPARMSALIMYTALLLCYYSRS